MDRIYVIALQATFGVVLLTLVNTGMFLAIENWSLPADADGQLRSCASDLSEAGQYFTCYLESLFPNTKTETLGVVPWLIWAANLVAGLLLTVPVSINLHRRRPR